jgi:hypothetical protein
MEQEEIIDNPYCSIASKNPGQFDQDFKPKGAITFFVLLVILGLIIWYGIYFLMLKRA